MSTSCCRSLNLPPCYRGQVVFLPMKLAKSPLELLSLPQCFYSSWSRWIPEPLCQTTCSGKHFCANCSILEESLPLCLQQTSITSKPLPRARPLEQKPRGRGPVAGAGACRAEDGGGFRRLKGPYAPRMGVHGAPACRTGPCSSSPAFKSDADDFAPTGNGNGELDVS